MSDARSPSVADLTRESSLVFRGTVVAVGASSVEVVRDRDELVVVEVERGLRVDPVLGDVAGRRITVELRPQEQLATGDDAIFFTRSWIHGEEIAVHEVGRADPATEAEVEAAVAALPDLHVQDRMAEAEWVVLAEVSNVRDVGDQSQHRRSPQWKRATLAVEQVLKGSDVDRKRLEMYFPTGDAKRWFRAPRLTRGERAVFVLRAGEPRAVEWFEAAGLPADSLTALDPADIQPEQRADRMSQLAAP